jgi:hypothetical protein
MTRCTIGAIAIQHQHGRNLTHTETHRASTAHAALSTSMNKLRVGSYNCVGACARGPLSTRRIRRSHDMTPCIAHLLCCRTAQNFVNKVALAFPSLAAPFMMLAAAVALLHRRGHWHAVYVRCAPVICCVPLRVSRLLGSPVVSSAAVCNQVQLQPPAPTCLVCHHAQRFVFTG